jgi:dolichol-phosphate mannosyltransferase
MAMEPEISIVVPLFDEVDNVAPLTERILAAFRDEPRPLELILVDDASTDSTWARIGEMKKKDPRVRGVRHLQNAGQSASLWTGFKAARGQIIATLDGDLQNDPADLPAMLALLKSCDLVCGVRTKRMDNALRRISTRIARAARKLALGVDFQDTGCNLRVFQRNVLEDIPPFNGLHRFMPVLAHAAGARVKETPVLHHPRVAGKSKYGVWNRLGRGIYDLIGVGWFQKRRLKRVRTVEHEETVDRAKV